jgi:carbon monoxide dehydrogenase subunit G
MKYQTSVAIAAPADEVWGVLSDIRGWPGWTSTVTAVDGPVAPLRVGHVHVVTQPRRRPTAYTVEDLVDGRSFSWSSGNQVVRQQADHEVVPAGEGCFVTLSFEMTGTLGNLLSSLAATRIRAFVDTEAASLKACCEHPA